MPAPTRRTGRYGLLLLATVLSVAVQGTVEPGAVQQVFVTALAGACLLLAFRAANLTPRLIQIASALAIAALVALGPPAVAVGVVRDLRTTGQVRLAAVFGVLSLYILIGMAFGFIYGAIDQLGGDPFFAGGQTATVSHCLYFSLTTLATVGYGDFVARTDFGHTLAVSEALVGQIYLVTVVSLIVSNLGRPARGDASQPT